MKTINEDRETLFLRQLQDPRARLRGLHNPPLTPGQPPAQPTQVLARLADRALTYFSSRRMYL
ncbi:hypothetical protein JST97_23490 [bacterium]|nr:hypothetical protein [bacterium]